MKLTRRERQILELLKQWKTRKDIAAELFITLNTVNSHITQAMKRNNVKCVNQLIIQL